MKKLALLSLVAVASVGSFALADILLPDQVVISGESAQELMEKIVRVTGKTPQDMRGREYVSAHAGIVCFKSGESYACQVNVAK